MTVRGWIICSGVLVASLAGGHAIHTERVAGGVGLRVLYDGGYPMAHAEVQVYAPDDEPEAVYQAGYTDTDGYFLFYPARTGVWRMVVDDGMGHRATETWNIGGDEVQATSIPTRRARGKETLLGLVVIAGMFALLTWWRRKVKAK